MTSLRSNWSVWAKEISEEGGLPFRQVTHSCLPDAALPGEEDAKGQVHVP